MDTSLYYGLSSLVLGVLLFFPVRRLVMNMSINRLQRKANRAATTEEREALRRKATVIAALIAVSFAFFYNKYLVLTFFGPGR